MIQRPVIAGNNGGDEFFFQQNDSDSNMKSRNPDTNVNRGTSHLFYKTRMCQKFLEGNCRNGHNCTFAHGSKDLRDPMPNWQEILKENRGGGNWNDDQKIIHRMRICRKFYNGDECPYGEKCNFLHESPSKFKAGASMNNIKTVVDLGQTEGDHSLRSNVNAVHVISTTSTDPDVLRASVKGRICSKWETTGQCVFADKCQFAHGFAESEAADPASVGSVQKGEVKGLGKWKLAHKKLNRIYGDWIDDEEDESSVAD